MARRPAPLRRIRVEFVLYSMIAGPFVSCRRGGIDCM